MDRTHEPFALRQIKFFTLKNYGHTYKFYLNHYISFERLSEHGGISNFEVILGQTLNYFVQNSVILGSVIYL
jgi:hypothetical protein